MGSAPWKVRPLADEFVVLYESPDPQNIYAYSPGLARLPNGRLVATMDLGGPGVEQLPEFREQHARVWPNYQGRIYTSDDRGRTWTVRNHFPFLHARPFTAGQSLYVLGHDGDLMVIRSDDWGDTWSRPWKLTEGQQWIEAPCNVHYANGCVYLVMEKRTRFDNRHWWVNEVAPTVMRGKIGEDLTTRANWAFASEMPFYEAVSEDALDFFGVPFYSVDRVKGGEIVLGRYCAPLGWLEANVVQFVDPAHLWYDPKGRTFHLWMRAHTGRTGFAAVLKVVEDEDGSMTTMFETVPSGRKILYVPCPGGQVKFHVLYDESTRLYWLISTQATDSMTRADRLSEGRYGLPHNERRRLQLHFSKNMLDWCFAGLVTAGPAEKASRHYATMVIDGDDLAVLSRSGDEKAKSAHDGNLITFHRIEGFRELVY